MAKKFSKREAVRFGWQIFKQNLGFFIILSIVVGLISVVPHVISSLLEKESRSLPFIPLDFIVSIVSTIGAVLGTIVSLGLIKISLNFCDNLKSKIADIFSQYRLFFKYLLASILYYLAVLVGSILLITPGIYLAIRLKFYDYFIVDRRSGIIESLKKSWLITQGSVWNLFLFRLLLGLINLLGLLALMVGLFATLPITMVATAFVYRKLLTQSETSEETRVG